MDILKSWKGRMLAIIFGVVLIAGLLPSIAFAAGGAQLSDVAWTQIGASDCRYKIETSGNEVTLTIAPTNGVSGTLPDDYTLNDWPWYGEQGATANTITKAVVASGVKAGNSTAFMFSGCKNLTSFDLSGFDTSNVNNMENMFNQCKNLTSLDLSKFNTSNVTTMGGMFSLCSKLETLDLSKFDTSNVTNMSGMFAGCSNLETLDLSKFDTSKVTNTGGMFGYCSNLEILDLSKFDTSKVTNMGGMFDFCTALKKILVGSKWSTEKVTESTDMFSGCTSLEGSKGTKCDGTNNIKATYARVDGGVDSPGYLTFKKYGADKTAIQGDGATWTLGSSDALVLSCGGELADCTSIRISGNGIDMQLYDGKSALVEGVTVTEGSTVLTFQPAVLEKLAAGTYQVTFSYDEERYDPSTATATFTVAAATEVPKAGDTSALAFAGLAVAAAAAAGLALVASRLRRD